MENILDIFNEDAFSVTTLTAAISLVPNMYGRIGEMGLFGEEGISSIDIALEQENGVLSILPASERGGPATKNKSGKRKVVTARVPHFNLEDTVLASAIQGVRGMRGEAQLQTVAGIINRRLIEMKRKHDITKEWLRAGALRGVVMDSDASTLVNLFTLLGVTEKVVDFKLGTDATNMQAKIAEVKDRIEAALLGDTMTGVGALCSRTWFDKFVNHKQVKEAYAHQVGINPNRDDLSDGFNFKGINFRVYVGNAPDAAGVSRKFIADGDVRFYPMGTSDTFRQYNAPADMIEYVNTIGLPFYASQERLDHGRGVELYTEMNTLPVVRRPGVLVRGHTSD